jgi:hypothetical protein
MKTTLALILGMTVQLSLANATQSTNLVERLLPNIMNRVSECSVRPYTVDQNGSKTYHAMISHCPEVQVTSPGVATVKVDAYTFQAVLSESPDSDGDFYHVTIQDVQSGQTAVMQNVPAYGDILLGLMGGNGARIREQQIVTGDADSARADSLLVR